MIPDVMFPVWDEQAQAKRLITRQEAVDNLMAQAAHLGKGTPAAGVLERHALEIAQGGTAGFSTVTAETQAARKAA